jgi:predicted DNA-binding transcriptional regulator YafY
MGSPKFKPQLRRLMFIEREIRGGTYPSCRDLAGRWEVSTRTILRDLDYLRDELDAPIEYDSSRHGFSLSDPDWNMSKVVLSEGEILALLVGSQIAGMFEGTPVGDELMLIYEKLEHLLPEKVTLDPASIASKFSFVHGPSRIIDQAIWGEIVRALLQQFVIEVEYESHRSPDAKHHILHPYHAANIEGEWYLFAHSERWGDIAQYAFGRIKSVRVTERRYRIPADTNIATHIANSTGRFVSTAASKPVTVWLRFAPDVADYISEHSWHPKQVIKRRRDGALDLSFPSTNLESVVPWVLGYAGQVEVQSPKKLRSMIAANHKTGWDTNRQS